ncbi:TPA: fimbria/pilus periplasmic chaperone [Escherichia coli]|nr:fimbria/pilus periplasmic chaperone [Escherichia coli]HBC0974490.1 fimbria/pilus periplasmic chaperone [Escherichia coli]
MQKNHMMWGILVAGSLVLGDIAQAAGIESETSSQVFSLHVGETRVIYNPDSAGSILNVINDHDYPVLVQSGVFAEDKKTKAPFVVTPPLFRLDAYQSSRLRVVQTGGDFPRDHESLQWLCVKGIPPKPGDKWAGNKSSKADKVSLQVQFSISSCIKLFVRPSVVKGHPEDAAGKVEWQKVGNKLKGTNTTPFYINLSELRIGNKKLEHHYIAPFSSYEFTLPTNASGKIQWTIVTDYGGISRVFEAELKRKVEL